MSPCNLFKSPHGSNEHNHHDDKENKAAEKLASLMIYEIVPMVDSILEQDDKAEFLNDTNIGKQGPGTRPEFISRQQQQQH